MQRSGRAERSNCTQQGFGGVFCLCSEAEYKNHDKTAGTRRPRGRGRQEAAVDAKLFGYAEAKRKDRRKEERTKQLRVRKEEAKETKKTYMQVYP